MSRLMNQDVPWESHTLPSSSSSSSSTSSICKPWNLPDIHPIFNSGRSFGMYYAKKKKKARLCALCLHVHKKTKKN